MYGPRFVDDNRPPWDIGCAAPSKDHLPLGKRSIIAKSLNPPLRQRRDGPTRSRSKPTSPQQECRQPLPLSHPLYKTPPWFHPRRDRSKSGATRDEVGNAQKGEDPPRDPPTPS